MVWIWAVLIVSWQVVVIAAANWAAKHLGKYLHVTLKENSTIYHGRSTATITQKCSDGHQVAVWLTVATEANRNQTVFRKCWSCHTDEDVKFRNVVFRLPKQFAFRPSHLNPDAEVVKHAALVAAITEYASCEQVPKQYTKVSRRKVKEKRTSIVRVASPYDRPLRQVSRCFDWLEERAYQKPYTPQCPKEPEVFEAVQFPVALSGGWFGVYRSIPLYTHQVLEAARRKTLYSPQFTYSLWLYIVEYCPTALSLCSIVHRVTWDDMYVTPLILINQQGVIHLQLASRNPRADQAAFLSAFPLVKKQWCHLVVSYANHTWEATMLYGSGWSQSKYSKLHVRKNYRVYMNDTEHVTVFGGSEVIPSFKGYLGKATVYRNRKLTPREIPVVSPYHPMFELGLSEREERCANYLNWARHRIRSSQQFLLERIRKDTCADFYGAITNVESSRMHPQCSVFDGSRYRLYRPVSRWIKQRVMEGRNVSLSTTGRHLYSNATNTLEKLGLRHTPTAVVMLKQAACYGNEDATFLLSVLLNYGVVVRVHEIKAHSYLLDCALEGNQLCQLTMANKHIHGLDGVPVDLEQAYVYLKSVADRTRQDRNEHRNTDIHTEHIRLTDDKTLQHQTDEDGDLFNWIKHQAQQGVTSAQKELARMLHWGSQGIRRNLREAAEYYRRGAQGDDPVANYDYGIILLRGQGVDQNTTEALHYLHNAASKGHVQSLNALGWHALEIEKNGSKAIEYFEKAYKRGNADAAHNLGHIYYNGLSPDKPADRIAAFDFFSFAALKGQIDSATMVAILNMRGHPKVIRSPSLGVWWSRFVAEKNPALGWVLAKGLKAYRHQDWETALLYYLMAASTGVEVANFNLAYLCEENVDGLTSLIEKECTWRHYNLSTQGSHTDPYAWIKMGDYYWYGCGKGRQALRAAHMYANAAAVKDPHAIFNLAVLVEEGVYIPEAIWKQVKLSRAAQRNNVTLLTELYTRCKGSHHTEAYIPCSLALLRIQLLDAWARYNVILKLSSVMGTATVVAVTLSTLYGYFKNNRLRVHTL